MVEPWHRGSDWCGGVSSRGGRLWVHRFYERQRGARWPRRLALREAVQGAETDPRPEGLADIVPTGSESAYRLFCECYPAQQLQLQLLYGTSQGAFERKTRQSIRITVHRVLRNVLSDPRIGTGRPDEYLMEYLEDEIARLKERLAQDNAVAVSRGLVIGLGRGITASTVLVAVPLFWGAGLLQELGVTLDCANRWSLFAALVCGGAGAFGAVLSVLVRLRGSADDLVHQQASERARTVVPGQMARSMRHEGLYRVFVGWILALAAYFLLSSGVLTAFSLPGTTADLCRSAQDAGSSASVTGFWGFWCAIGLVAGLSERWAFGLLPRSSVRRRNRVPEPADTTAHDLKSALHDALSPKPPVTFRGAIGAGFEGDAGIEDPDDSEDPAWRIRGGEQAVLRVELMTGKRAAVMAALETRLPSHAVIRDLSVVAGRTEPTVEIEVVIDAPYLQVAEEDRVFTLNTENGSASFTTSVVAKTEGEHEIRVAAYSSGRLIQSLVLDLLFEDAP